jgi:hypothetical protein
LLRNNLVWSFMQSNCNDLTVKELDVVSFQTKASSCVDSWISMKRVHRWSYLSPLLPVRGCLKPIFNGTWDITLAIETCFLCTILYKDVYCWERGVFPSHVSSREGFARHYLPWRSLVQKTRLLFSLDLSQKRSLTTLA